MAAWAWELMGMQWTFDSSVQDRISSAESETWVVLDGENIGYAEIGKKKKG